MQFNILRNSANGRPLSAHKNTIAEGRCGNPFSVVLCYVMVTKKIVVVVAEKILLLEILRDGRRVSEGRGKECC